MSESLTTPLAVTVREGAAWLGISAAALRARIAAGDVAAAAIRRERDACRLALYGRAKAVSEPVG